MTTKIETRKAYETDLTDAQWEIIAPMLPPEVGGGRHRSVDLREVVNAIFYRLRTGCAWKLLPHDFPPKSTVFWYFRNWSRSGTLQAVHDALAQAVRVAAGRDPAPSAAILDSQSVKTSEVPSERGYDGGKKIKGHKRHLVVDTLGLIVAVLVTAANVQDRDGAKLVLAKVKNGSRLEKIWADGAYSGQLIGWVKDHCGWVLEIKRRPEEKGFHLIKHRWIVERTFGWLGRYRLLAKDYAATICSSESEIQLAMIHRMLNRLAIEVPANEHKFTQTA